VYKNFDPRAKIIRAMCYRVLDKLGIGNDPLFELALILEEIALKDEIFCVAKALSECRLLLGIIYSALEFLVRCSRCYSPLRAPAGWVAHWQEMVSDPHMRIGRPRQLYAGSRQRDYHR